LWNIKRNAETTHPIGSEHATARRSSFDIVEPVMRVRKSPPDPHPCGRVGPASKFMAHACHSASDWVVVGGNNHA
jgi:hypothetical protein